MNSRNASGELICSIEEGGVAVGDLFRQRQYFCWHTVAAPHLLAFLKQLNCLPCPASPMAKQSTNHADANFSLCGVNLVMSQQIKDNVVIITGVESDIACASCLGQRAYDIQSLIAIEGRDFDRDNIGNRDKALPEIEGEQAATHRGLKIKPHEWNFSS